MATNTITQDDYPLFVTTKLPSPEEAYAASGSTWKRIELIKKSVDESGQVSLKKKMCVVHLPSKEVYRDEDHKMTALKSLFMFIGTPFYAAGMVLVHLVRIAIDVVKVFQKAIKQAIAEFKDKESGKAIMTLLKGIGWDFPKGVALAVWRVVRGPFLAIGMLFTTLMGAIGICSANLAYTARRMTAKIEYLWHEKASYKDDFRVLNDENLKSFFKQITKGKVCFLGFCMQSIGKVDNKKYLFPQTSPSA